MVNPPAVCTRCGHRFAFPNMFGPGARNVLFRGNSTSCPRCGGPARIADFQIDSVGRLRYIHSLYDILANRGISQDELERAAGIARRARPESADAEQVLSDLAAVNPALAAIGALIRPTNPNEFWTMMGVLLALLMWLQASFAARPPEVNTTIINYVTSNLVVYDDHALAPESPAVTEAPRPAASRRDSEVPRVGRNAPCPCSSGEKYKRCHGR